MKKLSPKKTSKTKEQMSAEEFDRRFDEGADMTGLVDWSTPKVTKPASQRVAVDFPEWMVVAVDAEASRIGLTRQALLKVWVSEKLNADSKKSA